MNDVERPSTAANGEAEKAVGWKEAADILGWKVETLRKRTAARTVPHIREGKSITFLPSVLREWMVDRSLASLREQHAPATAPVTRKRRTTMSTVCATQYNLASSSDADLRPIFVEDHPYTLADLEETAEESGGGLVVIIRSVSPWQTHNNSN